VNSYRLYPHEGNALFKLFSVEVTEEEDDNGE
jgi:hypothetical protein